MSAVIIRLISEYDEWNWIEESISKKHIKLYDYKHFKNIEEIGAGSFGKVYRAKWKHQYFALKSLLNTEKGAIKELVNEVTI
jgi:serine/threonine protein kinase